MIKRIRVNIVATPTESGKMYSELRNVEYYGDNRTLAEIVSNAVNLVVSSSNVSGLSVNISIDEVKP